MLFITARGQYRMIDTEAVRSHEKILLLLHWFITVGDVPTSAIHLYVLQP